MAKSQQLHPEDLSQQLKSINNVKETLQETKSNNEKFWHLERNRTCRKEDHSQRSRETLRELQERLLKSSEQSDETDKKLNDLSRSMREVCNQIETNVQKTNRNKHDSSLKADTKKHNWSHSNVKDTKQQVSGDKTRDTIPVRHKQPHQVEPQRKTTTEKRTTLQINPPQSGQPLARSRGTQNTIKENKEGVDSKKVRSANKEDRQRQSRKDKSSALISGTTMPTKSVPQGLPKTTTTRPRPSVITRNDFGLKRSKTETEGDNRLTYLVEHSQSGARSRSSGRRRKFADLELENLNISREDAFATKGETAETECETKETKAETEEAKGETEDTTDYLSKLLSLFKDDAGLFPGLSGLLSGGDSEAVLGYQKWFEFAENQKNNGVKPKRGKGPDTVLCLDTSKSMEGAHFQEMISIALDIVNGIEQVAGMLSISENISVTTFGENARVVLHLTNDYTKVKDAIKSLHTTKGTTPMAGGLLVALAGVLGNSSNTTIKGFPVPGRIIMISDGLGTPDHVSQGDDVVTDIKSQMLVEHNLKDVSLNLKKRGNRVYCVPVRNAKMHLLETVSSITRGKIYQPTEYHRLVRMTQDTLHACELVEGVMLEKDENDEDTRKRLEFIYDGAMAMIASIVKQTPDEREDVLELSMFIKKLVTEHGGKDEAMLRELYSDLPSLGTRMRRGPSWHYPDHQDSHGPGTVFTHGSDGMVWVEWDNGHKNCYNYRNKAKREIVEVDEPRILKDQLIATGCRVKRGPNWRPELQDQDGGPGKMGTVIRVHKHGIVDVRWDNKKIADYRFGFEGHFELELCNEANSSRSPRSRDLQNQNGDHGLLIESFLDPVEVMNRRNKMKSDS